HLSTPALHDALPIFIDLRDRFGITQVVFNPEIDKAAHETAGDLRNEYVIRVDGLVRQRPEGTANPKMATGEIEVEAHAVTILNTDRKSTRLNSSHVS